MGAIMHTCLPFLATISPKLFLFSLVSEIDVRSEIKVWPNGDSFVVGSDKNSSGSCFTTGDLTNSVAALRGEQVSHERVQSVEQKHVAALPHL